MNFYLQIFSISFMFVMSMSVPISRHVQTEWVQYSNEGSLGPGNYAYGFDIEDAATSNVQFRHERRNANGTTFGSYGLLEPDGNLRIVHYVADHEGYRANIENTKHKNEAHPNLQLYKDNDSGRKYLEELQPRLEITTKSHFLQAAEQNLPQFGQNYNENHIPPALLVNKLKNYSTRHIHSFSRFQRGNLLY